MKQKAIVLNNLTAAKVARTLIECGQKETFFIMDLDQICERIEYWRQNCPRVKIFYAVKANDHEWLLKIMVASGAGFDCASPGEINKILRLNVSPRSIIYAQPVKSAEQMKYARAAGVTHTTFDSVLELLKLKDHWPDARLLIRIKVSSKAKYNLSDKYGIEPGEEAALLLDAAANNGLKVVGVAFHVGSGLVGMGAFESAIKNAHALFEHEASKGRKLQILDIGGGFMGDRTDEINKYLHEINTWVDKLFPDPEVQVFGEPGRYMCQSAFTLYCTINNINKAPLPDKDVKRYYLGEGVYGTLRFTEPWHKVEKFQHTIGDFDAEPLEEVMLFGPTCDSTDVVMSDRKIRLPHCLPNDWIVFYSQGAYSITVISPFSSLPMPNICIVISNQFWNKLRYLPGMKECDVTSWSENSKPLPSTLPSLYKSEEIFSHTPELLL